MNRRLYLLILFCTVAIFASAQKSKVYVLSIGVSKYAQSSINLTLPAADADTVASLFSNREGEFIVLKDSAATGKNIKNTARKLFSKAEKQDIILMFFSGHGYGNGFCAHDFNKTIDGTLSFDEIKELFRLSKAHGKMMIADACYSGAIRVNKVLPDSVSQALKKKSQVMLFLSSRGNETSLESPQMTNGYFTTYLAKGLRGAADYNKNGNITAGEIATYVSTSLNKELGGRQHSVVWGNFSTGWIINKLPRVANPIRKK